MKLDDYLKNNGISGASFAERIGVNPATVFRIRTGRVFPHRSTLMAIVAATNGAVSANDLVEMPTENKGEQKG